jgi:hypothetical protein
MRPERDFLHDISTPIATVLFLLDTILPEDEAEKNQSFQKLKKKISEIQKLVEDRRREVKGLDSV